MKKRAVCTGIISGVVIVMGIVLAGMLRWKLEWESESNTETNIFLANAERGFYNMRGVMISDAQPVEEWVYESIRAEQPDETIELLQIHIGHYGSTEISAAGLEQIRKTFDAYAERKHQVRLIVRFLYDWDGNGAGSDPSSINIVLRHMEQLGEIVSEYEDQIYIIQGVLVGSWAEMHSSRYLTAGSYQTLIRKMDETTPDSVFLAVRTPAYWRMAAGRKDPLKEEEAWNSTALISRLSFFNDGILGNELDCGTYGDIPEDQSESLQDRWSRADELSFQNTLNLYVPNGGEAVLDNSLNDLDNADQTFQTMHISYLNKAHDTEVIEKWKNTKYLNGGSVYDGLTGYDYIERHLGYRFAIRKAEVTRSGWKWEKEKLTVRIENVGYAPRYTPCLTEIIIKNTADGKIQTLTADTDVRKWRPGETVSFTVPLDIEETGEYEVWLRVTGEKDKKAVLFASENPAAQDGSCLLGTIRKGE